MGRLRSLLRSYRLIVENTFLANGKTLILMLQLYFLEISGLRNVICGSHFSVRLGRSEMEVERL